MSPIGYRKNLGAVWQKFYISITAEIAHPVVPRSAGSQNIGSDSARVIDKSGNSSRGRATASQAVGSGFESRFPLFFFFAHCILIGRIKKQN